MDTDPAPSFAVALRAAIDQRGLGLERIVTRLEEAGTPVSAATLSYWQSGRSQPGRRASLESLATLEQILQVESGALAGRLGPPAVRGRNLAPPTWSELWEEVPAVVSAFEQISRSREDYLTRVSYHDRVFVGPDRTERSTWTRQVMRGERDGVDRFVAVRGNDDPRCPAPQIRALDRCEVGRVTGPPGSGITAAELLLPRPLRRGEFVTVEYEFVQSPPYPPADRYERRRRGPSRQYVLEVDFDEAAYPVSAQRYSQGVTGQEEAEELPLEDDHRLLMVELDGRAGVVGARWQWPTDSA